MGGCWLVGGLVVGCWLLLGGSLLVGWIGGSLLVGMVEVKDVSIYKKQFYNY